MPIRKRTIGLALDYTEKHFGVRKLFPIKPGAKFPPLIKDNLAKASSDPAQLIAWENQWPGCNWGLSHRVSNVMGIDIDTNPKKGKQGQATYDDLDLIYGWPDTEMTITPSGGYHKIYEALPGLDIPMALGENGIGKDIDVPNYTLIAGSTFDDGTSYVAGNGLDSVPCPQWIYDVIKSAKTKARITNAGEVVVELDKQTNINTAIDFLKVDAEPSIQGSGGDYNLLKAAYYLKDLGISQELGASLLNDYFNPRCEPPWDMDDLAKKMVAAYSYANLSKVGGKTAEADFADDDAATAAATPVPTGIYNVEQKKYVTKEETKAEDDKLFAEFSDWVWVINMKRWINTKDGIAERKTWDTTSFDSRYNSRVAKKRGSASDILLRRATGIRKVDTIAFKPGMPLIVTDAGTSALNLYRTPLIVPREGDLTWWNEHLEYLFPEQEYRGHLLNWMGWLVKNITKKPKHALIIQGEVNGTGKSFIGKVLAAILHSANVAVVPQNGLAGRFNSWAAQAKLILIEELRAGDRMAVKEALHDIVTEDTISVERKGVDPIKVDNCFGVLAFTNDDAALSLDKTDRRYLVIKTDRTKAEADAKQAEGYFIRLFAKIDDPDAMAAVMYSLVNRDFGGYSGQQAAPLTAAKQVMHRASMPELEHWLDENRLNWPLDARIIRVDDVLEAMPTDLTRKSAKPRIAIKKFLMSELEMVSLGQCTTPRGDRPHLYASKSAAGILMNQPRTVAGKLYEDDMKKIKASLPLNPLDTAAEFDDVDDMLQ
jgi:hypothetical protein